MNSLVTALPGIVLIFVLAGGVNALAGVSCHNFKTNSVVRLKYGTAPCIFSHVTNIKYQHRKDLLTTLF